MLVLQYIVTHVLGGESVYVTYYVTLSKAQIILKETKKGHK